MIAIMVQYDGDWEVYDIVSNIEHAMAIATEVQELGLHVGLADDPWGEMVVDD